MTVGVRDSFVNGDGDQVLTMEVDAAWGGTLARNSYDPSLTASVAGRNRSFDSYDLGAGAGDTVNGTAGNDALFFTTAGSARLDSAGNPVATAAHFAGVERFVLDLGNDVLDLTAGPGGSGSYAARVEVYGDTDYGRADGTYGDDVLWGGLALDDTLVGDTYQLGGTAVAGDDLLHAGASGRTSGGSISVLYGDAVWATGEGVCGDDVLVGGDGGDHLYGDAWVVKDDIACGDDTLTGGGGSDSLFGDYGTLAYDQLIFRLPGRGERGFDTFVFGNDSGRDQIEDFQCATDPGDVSDTIRVSTAYGVDSYDDLTITENPSGFAVISLDGTEDQIILTNVRRAWLTAADFEFF
jgi:hypothetical protein